MRNSDELLNALHFYFPLFLTCILLAMVLTIVVQFNSRGEEKAPVVFLHLFFLGLVGVVVGWISRKNDAAFGEFVTASIVVLTLLAQIIGKTKIGERSPLDAEKSVAAAVVTCLMFLTSVQYFEEVKGPPEAAQKASSGFTVALVENSDDD